MIENGFYLRSVSETHRRARGVGDKLSDEVAGDLALILKQQAIEIPHIAEFAPIGQHAGGIYRLCGMEDEGLAVFAEAFFGRLVLRHAEVAVRHAPMMPKLSSAKPGGSMLRWHAVLTCPAHPSATRHRRACRQVVAAGFGDPARLPSRVVAGCVCGLVLCAKLRSLSRSFLFPCSPPKT